jgi:NAD(P)H dehydrogenase (quinone)
MFREDNIGTNRTRPQAGSFADNNGSRPPSAFELEIAREQGKAFYELVSRVSFAQPNGPVEQAPIAANEEANTVQEHAAASH